MGKKTNDSADLILKQRDTDYDEYAQAFEELEYKYNGLRDSYNNHISIINNERVAMREEIRRLYDFLKAIGGSMGNRLSIFDFSMEDAAVRSSMKMLPKLEDPNVESTYGLADSLVRTIAVKSKNKKKLQVFTYEVIKEREKQQKDIEEKNLSIAYLSDANIIAELYRNIIIIVRDAIREKILPELGLIKAFLYADAIREQILDGMTPTEVYPNSIEEYKGTRQDIHYQFVRNVVDFYTITTEFFKRKILTEIVSDRSVTDEEKEEFNQQIEGIKKSVNRIEEMKVL